MNPALYRRDFTCQRRHGYRRYLIKRRGSSACSRPGWLARLATRWRILRAPKGKTGGTVKNPTTGATVTVYRVEGTPNTRILIGDKVRAQEFLQKRISQNMDGVAVKTFDVPGSVLEDLRRPAVKESVARLPENKGKPVIADPTKAGDQYGIRPEKLQELKDKILQGSGKDVNKR